MKNSLTTTLIMLVALAVVVGLVAPAPVDAQNLRRLVAEFQNFNSSETSTAAGVPGDLVYSRVINSASENDILYVTISGTADQHGGALLMLSCNVDGVFCNPGGGGASVAPGGWIAVQKTVVPSGGSTNCDDGGGGAGDCHDTSFLVTWCTTLPRVDRNIRTVNIRMATDSPGSDVFFEQAHIYIDASRTVGGCKAA